MDTQTSDDRSEAESIYRNPEALLRSMGRGLSGDPPMPTFTTAEAVRTKAQKYVSQIFDCFTFLKDVLDRHEEKIYKRWTKKTRNQRCRLLASAWPDMAMAHRPDFAALRAETAAQRSLGTRYRDSFLMPYINMDDLSRSKVVPLLLNARAHNFPGDFAFSDLEACHIGLTSSAIVPEFLKDHMMVFSGRNTASTYGTLVNWEGEPDAFRWIIERLAPQPGEGLLTLEIQSRLYVFLKDLCKLIMHDIPVDELISDKCEIQPRFQPLSENDTEIHASLAVLAMEAPYRRPAPLDWARIRTLLSAKMTAAEDHIWSLREDPGYFADTVLEYHEHRPEIITDSQGDIHPVFIHHRNTFWGRVLGNVIVSAYISLEAWHELARQAGRLGDLEHEHRDHKKQDAALLKFEHYLKQSTQNSGNSLKHSVAPSPAFRKYFERAPPPNSHTSKVLFEQKPNVDMDKPMMELKYLLGIIWEDGQELFLLGLTNVVDELQRFLQSEPRTAESISTYLAATIGDLSITCECLRQIQTYYPWAANFEEAFVDSKDDILEQFERRTAPWRTMMASLTTVETIVDFGNPEDGKFRYPIDKRRSKENVGQLQKAEHNLDTFWIQVDQLTSKNQGFAGLASGRLLQQAKILKRTPDWVEPEKVVTQTEDTIKDIAALLSALYFDERKIKHDAPRPKEKKKTKGGPAKKQQCDAEVPLEIEHRKQPTFEVDNRAMKVFRALFYTPSLTATPGEIRWNDFVHAMVSVGFSAEKLYGSVWHFSPMTLNVNRSIQFHDPHPLSKLPYRTARRFGRRLDRAYGWHAKMFVQKVEKSAIPRIHRFGSIINMNNSVANDFFVAEDDEIVAEIFGREYFIDAGQDDVVIICFHGSGKAGPEWRILARKLAQGLYTVVFLRREAAQVDPVGYVKALTNFLEKRRMNGPFLLIAHSYGGAFAKRFLFERRNAVVGILLAETGKGGLSDDAEDTILRQAWLDPAPLAVIRGNSFSRQWHDLATRIATVESGQESRELEARKKWLEACSAEDERLEKDQLRLSLNHRYVYLPNCTHNVIHDAPDVVFEQVQWLMDNRRSRDLGQWLSPRIHNLLFKLRSI